MLSLRVAACAVVAAFMAGAVVSSGQGPDDPRAVIAAQRDALKRFDFLSGEWRGSAWAVLPTGERHTFTQTERVGPFLGGSVRVIEGRGYESDGKTRFNALGIISYDPTRKAYSMRSYAQGRAGDFIITPTADGFSWEIPAGPMTMRYSARIDGDTWHEVGDSAAPGKEPVRFFEMTLTRIGDTEWPAGDPVGAK